jgi:hypothetical protein
VEAAFEKAGNVCDWTISPGVEKTELRYSKITQQIALKIAWPPATFQVAERALDRLFLSDDLGYQIILPAPSSAGASLRAIR